MIHIELERDGRLALPSAIANGLESRNLTLTSSSQRHLLLSTVSGGKAQVAMAGRLGELQIAEVLSMINMFRKSGLLHVSLEEGSRDLLFSEGELVSVSSSYPEEELGEFLLAAGKIHRDDLIKIRAASGGNAETLRSQLLLSGLVDQKDLWNALSAQMEAIVYHLIPCQSGDFVFFRQEKSAPATSPLSLSLQNLIMEGLRRADERSFFMRTLHSPDAKPMGTGTPAKGLKPDEERLLSLAESGRLSVRDLIQRSTFGEYKTLSLLHKLVKGEFLWIPEVKKVEIPEELAEILAIGNGVLAALYQKIYEKNHHVGREMRLFIRDLPQPFAMVLSHVTISDKGTIDGEQIAVNLADYPVNEQQNLLAETMSELVFLACILAKRDLEENESTRLVQQAQEIGKRMKELKERNKS